jgi:putative ABC transport system permease protein
MHSLLQDLRFAIRQLRKNPGFAITTMVTLALGIGATTAMFSLINSVLLRPLPFPEPGRLMSATMLQNSAGKTNIPESLSYPDFFDWRTRNHSFEALACYHGDNRTVTGAGTSAAAGVADRFVGILPCAGRQPAARPRFRRSTTKSRERMSRC